MTQHYYERSQSPIEYALSETQKQLRSINWNYLNDDKDLEVWNRVTQNFGCLKRFLFLMI